MFSYANSNCTINYSIILWKWQIIEKKFEIVKDDIFQTEKAHSLLDCSIEPIPPTPDTRANQIQLHIFDN